MSLYLLKKTSLTSLLTLHLLLLSFIMVCTIELIEINKTNIL